MEKEGTTMGHGRRYKTTFAHLQMCYCDRVQIMATYLLRALGFSRAAVETVHMYVERVLHV